MHLHKHMIYDDSPMDGSVRNTDYGLEINHLNQDTWAYCGLMMPYGGIDQGQYWLR